MLSVAKLKLADLEKEERQMEQGADGAATGTVVYAAVEKTGHHRSVADLKKKAEPEAPAPGAGVTEVMRHRLKTRAKLSSTSVFSASSPL